MLICPALLNGQIKTFHQGEQIVYRVAYSIFKAGEVEVNTDTSLMEVVGKPCIKISVHGYTTGVAGVFAQINDHWTSYIDTNSMLPAKFERDINENNYKLLESTEFDRTENTCFVTTKNGANSYQLKTYPIKNNVQDMVSAFFKLREIDFTSFSRKDTMVIPFFIQDTTLNLKVIYLGKQKIRTSIGRSKAHVLSPAIPEVSNSIFIKENPVKIWISEDEKRIPLQLRLSTKYGSAEAEIYKYNILKK